MTLIAHFLDKQHDSVQNTAFEIDLSSANLLVSALGYDIVDLETSPLAIDDLLHSIELYKSSDIASVIDTGRPEIIQHGGHVEGVTLPKGIPFKFPPVCPGAITQMVSHLEELALAAKKAGATSFLIPDN